MKFCGEGDRKFEKELTRSKTTDLHQALKHPHKKSELGDQTASKQSLSSAHMRLIP